MVPATRYLSPERSSGEEIQEQARAVSELNLLSEVLEVMPAGALVLNPNRQIVGANRMAHAMLGEDAVELLLGQRPGEVLDCSVASTAPSGCGTGDGCRECGLVNTVLKALNSGERSKGACRIRLSKNRALDLEVAALPAQLGETTYTLVGFRDTSAERRREVLEQTFFHDVLNTAGGLQGLVELMGSEGGGEQGDLFSILRDLVDGVVDEIRTHRKLLEAEAGELSVQAVELDPHILLGKLCAAYRRHTVGQGKELIYESRTSDLVRSDPTLLRRILGNLVKNALEAEPEGGQVRVTLARGEGDVLEFRVHNHAHMSPAVQHQVFQRSFSTKGAGRGTGTYSARLFGERYLGGRVSFTSGEDGTTFVLALPGAYTALVGVEPEPEQPIPQGIRALLADDNRVNRMVAQKLMEQVGWDVVAVENGQQAVARADSAFDLIVLDLNMPVMGGLEAARQLREGGMETPIVALSGGGSRRDREACIEAGMSGLVEKPFNRGKLVELCGLLKRVA